MSPIHFQFLEEAFRLSGYKVKVLPSVDHKVVDTGLKYVNNDACYPSIIVVGQIISALQSGKYDPANTSVIITQTGGGCRATNYIGFIRKALKDAGFKDVPVISLNANGIERNPGFKVSIPLINRSMMGLVYGDLLMNVLYRVRPYEKIKGSANGLYRKWVKICIDSLKVADFKTFKRNIEGIVNDFENLQIINEEKPRVGLVGEILVKFHPGANNDVVDIVGSGRGGSGYAGSLGFLLYCAYNQYYKYRYLAGKKTHKIFGGLAIRFIDFYRGFYRRMLELSKRFYPPKPISRNSQGSSHGIGFGAPNR